MYIQAKGCINVQPSIIVQCTFSVHLHWSENICNIFVIVIVCSPSHHTLVLVKSQRKVYAFGLNDRGQLGTGGSSNLSVPTPVLEAWSRPVLLPDNIDTGTPVDPPQPLPSTLTSSLLVRRVLAGAEQSFVTVDFVGKSEVRGEERRCVQHTCTLYMYSNMYIIIHVHGCIMCSKNRNLHLYFSCSLFVFTFRFSLPPPGGRARPRTNGLPCAPLFVLPTNFDL